MSNGIERNSAFTLSVGDIKSRKKIPGYQNYVKIKIGSRGLQPALIKRKLKLATTLCDDVTRHLCRRLVRDKSRTTQIVLPLNETLSDRPQRLLQFQNYLQILF